MRLQRLYLNNIRSYTNHVIDFRDGITLFEGDIGSGKSSILNAIEFALFGLGNLSGGHLLRVGENEGGVKLDLEINGRLYTFGRSLKRRRNSVQQEDCYIIEGDVKTEYNVTDMKKRSLQLLDFKEPTNPRSHSLIYRFAVFTPQEQMREVLGQKPEDRKQTLRKAFGVEEYSTALQNSNLLVNDLNIDIRLFQRSQEEIENIKERIREEENGVSSLQSNIRESETRTEAVKNEILKLENIIAKKNNEVQRLNNLNRDVEVKKRETEIHQKNLETLIKEQHINKENLKKSLQAEENFIRLSPQYRKLTENRERIRKLEKAKKEYDEKQHRIEIEHTKVTNAKTYLENRLTEQKTARERLIQRITSTETSLKGLEELENSAEKLGKETLSLSAFRQENLEKTGEAQSLRQKIAIMEDNHREKTNEWAQIESIGVGAECPHCMQELTTEHYKLLKEKYRNEINCLKNQIKKLTEEQEKLETYLSALEKKILWLTEKESNLQKLQIKISELLTRKEALRESLKEYEEIEQIVKDIQKNLENQEYALQSKKVISKLIMEVKNLETGVKQYTSIRKEIEGLEEKEVEKKYIENRNLSERKTEYQEKERETEKKITGIKETVKDLTEIITTLEEEADKYRESEKERNRIQEALTKANSELASTETIINQNISRIQEAEKRINKHKEDLDRHTINILKAEEHNINKTWLQEAFMPAISSIERNVLMTLNHEFNKLFKKWFKILIESEEIEAIVDEDFTPIIDQAGYELDVESLSGGEKTSVALAYRLALNTVVKRVTNTMKSNLLILDEPTDGFSKEQIYKIRDILTDLNCEQVIIVSHERELESVADHIYQVQKDGTVSTITEPRS